VKLLVPWEPRSAALEKMYKAATIGLDLNEKAHYHRIQRTLRDLYFFEDGTLALLKSLANNEPIASADFQKASSRYFSFSDEVYRSLQYVAEHSSYNNMGLSITDVNDIRRLLNFKIGVRAEIDEFIFEVEGPYSSSDNEMRLRFRAELSVSWT
jgi:hypothetical protein